jgi:hypothetical protein
VNQVNTFHQQHAIVQEEAVYIKDAIAEGAPQVS